MPWDTYSYVKATRTIDYLIAAAVMVQGKIQRMDKNDLHVSFPIPMLRLCVRRHGKLE